MKKRSFLMKKTAALVLNEQGLSAFVNQARKYNVDRYSFNHFGGNGTGMKIKSNVPLKMQKEMTAVSFNHSASLLLSPYLPTFFLSTSSFLVLSRSPTGSFERDTKVLEPNATFVTVAESTCQYNWFNMN